MANHTLRRNINRLLKYGTLLSTYGLIGSVLLQVFARFFLPNTPPWTEEASRLFFIYATAFASGLALKDGFYVHLDLFFNKFSPAVQRKILVAIASFTFVLFGSIAVYSVPFVLLGHAEFSPSMKIRMSLAFFSIFILSTSICYFALGEIRRAIKNLAS